MNGLYKALIFITLGNISFEIAKKIKGLQLNWFGVLVLSVIEVAGWCVSIANLHFTKIGLIMHAVLLVWNVSITFSGKTISSKIFMWSIWKKIGNYGFYLYLCQISIRTYVTKNYTGDYMTLLNKYIKIALITAAVIDFAVEIIYKLIIRRIARKILRFLFLKNDCKLQEVNK